MLNTKSTYKVLQDNAASHAAFKGAGETVDVKEVVRVVCEMEGYKDVRVTRLGVDELLKLLAEFNSRGVHFV